MSKCLKLLSPECVATRLSLVFSLQGYSVPNSISASLVRQNSTSSVCCHLFRATNQRHSVNRAWINELTIKRKMGSVISRGRKYSPKKRDPNNQASTSRVEHANFASGDSQVQNGDFIEKDVCKESELEENQMKVFEIGEDGGKVLVVKQKGKISALGAKCTHYGAPLVNGALGDGRIRCQWHGACFNIATGDIEDFPGLDSLPCYQVSINNGNVRVRANKKQLQTNKRMKEFTARDENNNTTFIVVGGGAAGANCVETLRQKGFSGKIILITAEPYPPYDRIKLSKALDIDVSKITLRPAEFYKEKGIDIMLSTEVTSIDPSSKSVKLSNNEELKYDKIFLATGSTPRRITAPGSDLKNIFVLRTVEDANQIKNALTPSANVVILGSSFIGMEAAAYCVDKAISVTVIARDKVPFKPSFGPVIGARIMKLFEEKGVKFQLEDSIVSFEGEEGALKSVTLKSGKTLPASICLIGIGVVPNTNILSGAGAKLERNGSIDVNEFLQTQWPDVYAGGDIAYAPVLGQKASIGHWGLANYHGHVAAHNMLGLKKPLNSVPFFWTVLFGKSFRYTGFASKFDDIVIDGDVKELKFAAYYCLGDHVHAITTINSDPLAAKFAEFLHQGKQLQKSQISTWQH